MLAISQNSQVRLPGTDILFQFPERQQPAIAVGSVKPEIPNKRQPGKNRNRAQGQSIDDKKSGHSLNESDCSRPVKLISASDANRLED